MQEHEDKGAEVEAFTATELDDAVEDMLDDEPLESIEVEQFDPATLIEPSGLLAEELIIDELEDEDEEDDVIDDEDDDDDDFLLVDAAPVTGPVAEVGESSALEQRIARLEEAAQTLAAAEVTREGRKLRRKVAAGTTGASTVGFVPILLELLGVTNLDPELAATFATVAAAIGSLAAGYFVPERKPPLPNAEAQALLDLGRPTPGV
jgi:hypothetical protein